MPASDSQALGALSIRRKAGALGTVQTYALAPSTSGYDGPTAIEHSGVAVLPAAQIIQRTEGTLRIDSAGEHNGEFEGSFVAGVPEHGIFTFDNGNVFTGTVMPDCRIKSGTMRYTNGEVYTGNFFDDGDSFNGTAHHLDGVVFEGRMVGDVWAEGTTRWPDGATFTGTFDEDGQMKSGTTTHAEGTRFQGEYVSGQRSRGKFICEDGKNVFDGSFDEAGDPAEGTQTWPNGEVFKGTFRAWKPHVGTRRYAKGGLFKGTFGEDGESRLRGHMTFDNGSTFEGTWVADKMGTGVRTWRAKTGICKLEGDFGPGGVIKEGTRGTLITPDGRFVGTFGKDGIRGNGKYIGNDGLSFEGKFSADGRYGEGTTVFPSGEEYTGTYADGLKNQGTYRFSNGNRFDGSFKDGKVHWGQLMFAGGGYYSGYFGPDGKYTDGSLTLSSGTVYDVVGGRQTYNHKLTKFMQHENAKNRVDGATADRVRGETNRMVDNNMFWQRYYNT